MFKYLGQISSIALITAILGAMLFIFGVMSEEYFISFLAGIMTGISISHMVAFLLLYRVIFEKSACSNPNSDL